MQFSQDISTARYQIRAYDENYVQINDEKYHQHLIITDDKLIHPWSFNTINTLNIDEFQQILTPTLQTILLGTGKTLQFPPIQLREALANRGVGFEVMTTAAACRTFTVLQAEQRIVAAILILPA